MEAENDSAALSSDGGVEKMLKVEEKREEFLQETMETSVTMVLHQTGLVEERNEEETKEDGNEGTEDGKEEEEEEEETKTKEVLGHWEAEASTDEKPPLPDPAFNRRCSLILSDVRYKEDFEKMKGQSRFVPGAELIHSKNISAVISESKYKEEGKKEASMSLYSILPETPQTQHAKEASELQSEVRHLHI
ncbi:nebulette-like [Cyprinodon tularosa]|uniref:nebulette-like n=1 Tax=Cyprinodon tularosa TaxID=77115 RepID=UPI0018E26BF1|nr:nebulette-like [Cyprinodon tularosa]